MVGVAIDSPPADTIDVRAQGRLALPDRRARHCCDLSQPLRRDLLPDDGRRRRQGAGRRPPGRPADRRPAATPSCARSAPEMPVLAEIALSPVGLSAAFAAGVDLVHLALRLAARAGLPLVRLGRVVLRSRRPDAARRRSPPAAFVLGFGVVFTALGAGAGAIGDLLTRAPAHARDRLGPGDRPDGRRAGRASAACCCSRSAACSRRGKPAGPVGAVVAGAGFGIGWTPCVGPTLAAILALAGRSGHALDGAVLLAVYSLGLGVPFLLSGLLFTRGLSSLAPLRRHAPLLVRASGVVLMALGALLALGQMTALTSDLASAFPRSSTRVRLRVAPCIAQSRSDPGDPARCATLPDPRDPLPGGQTSAASRALRARRRRARGLRASRPTGRRVRSTRAPPGAGRADRGLHPGVARGPPKGPTSPSQSGSSRLLDALDGVRHGHVLDGAASTRR